MHLKFMQILLCLALLPTALTRCEQKNSNSVSAFESEENFNPGTQETVINAVGVKFRIGARSLTGKHRNFKMVQVDPFPRVYINDNKKEINDSTCFVKSTQNPNFDTEYEVAFYESENTYLKIEIRDNVEGGDDFSLGFTYVYMRNMLCRRRTIESPLWNEHTKENNYLSDFNTGVVIVTTNSVSGTQICD